jgi:glycosyltransferase involved in cell wall biosynthesis
MARGLPVVTTAVGGLPDLIKHGENGLLVEPRTVENVVEQVERLSQDPGLRSRLAEAGIETAAELTFSAAAEQFGTILVEELFE